MQCFQEQRNTQKTRNNRENQEHPPRKPGTTPRKPGTPQNLFVKYSEYQYASKHALRNQPRADEEAEDSKRLNMVS